MLTVSNSQLQKGHPQNAHTGIYVILCPQIFPWLKAKQIHNSFYWIQQVHTFGPTYMSNVCCPKCHLLTVNMCEPPRAYTQVLPSSVNTNYFVHSQTAFLHTLRWRVSPIQLNGTYQCRHAKDCAANLYIFLYQDAVVVFLFNFISNEAFMFSIIKLVPPHP